MRFLSPLRRLPDAPVIQTICKSGGTARWTYRRFSFLLSGDASFPGLRRGAPHGFSGSVGLISAAASAAGVSLFPVFPRPDRSSFSPFRGNLRVPDVENSVEKPFFLCKTSVRLGLNRSFDGVFRGFPSDFGGFARNLSGANRMRRFCAGCGKALKGSEP